MLFCVERNASMKKMLHVDWEWDALKTVVFFFVLCFILSLPLEHCYVKKPSPLLQALHSSSLCWFCWFPIEQPFSLVFQSYCMKLMLKAWNVMLKFIPQKKKAYINIFSLEAVVQNYRNKHQTSKHVLADQSQISWAFIISWYSRCVKRRKKRNFWVCELRIYDLVHLYTVHCWGLRKSLFIIARKMSGCTFRT